MPSKSASIHPFRVAIEPEVSIVMPSLNEADTLTTCIRKANAALDGAAIHGEIIVADNGSTYGAVEIATRERARVVPNTAQGYGAATDTVPRFQPPLFFVGLVLVLGGLALYFLAIGFSIVRLALQLGPEVRAWNEALLWYSGMPATVGVLLVGLDLALLLPAKRRTARRRALEPLVARDVVVALTAYNDEASIGDAVRDFARHPAVRQVIVVDNNSRDATFAAAEAAGGRVVRELAPGYGRCVYRCLNEALETGVDLVVLCEGDMTFRASDIDKLLAYADHAHIVNGTRIVEQLRAYSTQLSTFMYYGNFFVGKLLEAKHLGRGTFTDVGTTYKLIRRDSLLRLMPALKPEINLEFNAHFMDTALAIGERLVECPITFHPRVGVSKGGNVSNLRALTVGMRMISGLYTNWR